MKKQFDRQLKKVTSWRHLDVTVLVVGIAAYTALVLSTMTSWSIWFDEAFSAYLIRFNVTDIAHYTALDVHPPMDYWILKIWTLPFGANEFSVRSLSLLCGIAAIVFGFLLVKKLFNRKAALISLLFMVISPILVHYGQEARMYAFVAAIGLAATYVLTIALESKKRLPWVLYAALIALGMWTHYFIAMVWLSHWVWRAVVLWQQKYRGKKLLGKFFTRQWIGAHVLAIALFVPWMPAMFHQLFDIQSGWFWIDPVGVDTVTNYVTTIFLFRQHNEVTGWLALLLIVVTTVLIVCAVVSYKRLNKTQRYSYALLASVAFVPVVLVFLASLPPLRSSFIERYMITSVIGFSLFAGVIVATATTKMKPILQGGVIGLISITFLIGVMYMQTIGNFNKSSGVSSDTKSLVAGLTALGSTGEPIISSSPYMFYEVVFYETDTHPVYYLKSTVMPESSGSLAMLQGPDSHGIVDLTAFATTHQKVWYVGVSNDAELTPPAGAANWKQLQSIRIDDPVTGKQRYQAVQYLTHQ